MPLLSLRALSLAFGGPPLLDGVDFDIDRGERVCVLGRNGAGKSSLLNLLAGDLKPDAGTIWTMPGLRLARLAQEAPMLGPTRVFDLVASGLGEVGALVSAYYRLSHGIGATPGAAELAQLALVQQQLEASGGWELEQRAERAISRLGLDAEADYAALSGGLRRRALLARALIREPDVLLLDEPTNHLDIATIEWLENFLLGWHGALLIVTHDRRFLRRLATRILELDRGQLTDWPGDYANYLRRRDERLHAEARERERFDKRLDAEELWIRQGIKARRTRNEGRVRALEQLRRERQARREQPGSARLRIERGERGGRLVIEATAAEFRWPGTAAPVIQGLDTLILRGDRIGIIGPNGAGKTTLLKLLLGQLAPTAGDIRRGTNLRIAYFDQLRAQLDPDASLCDNLAEGRDRIEIGGTSQHVLSYLKDFLFTPERARQPVSALSGGERNRLLLAKLFTLPANLLVLDEPTNDLDAETLELLEALLHDFDGTLLLVSHDRDLLDNLVTSTLVLEDQGRVTEYVGGYGDWLRQRPPDPAPAAPATPPPKSAQPTRALSARLSYREQRELEDLPRRIEVLESEQHDVRAALADPALYRSAPGEVSVRTARLRALEDELARIYERWETLEARRDDA